jgi:hypothetical protein
MSPKTLEALQAVVLPWAKAKHPDKYAMTLKVAHNPASFKAYLLRLLEIRWEEEPETRGGLPILALEETSVVVRTRLKNGKEVEFHGRNSPRRRLDSFRIAELALPRDEWEQLQHVRELFDLEYADP